MVHRNAQSHSLTPPLPALALAANTCVREGVAALRHYCDTYRPAGRSNAVAASVLRRRVDARLESATFVCGVGSNPRWVTQSRRKAARDTAMGEEAAPDAATTGVQPAVPSDPPPRCHDGSVNATEPTASLTSTGPAEAAGHEEEGSGLALEPGSDDDVDDDDDDCDFEELEEEEQEQQEAPTLYLETPRPPAVQNPGLSQANRLVLTLYQSRELVQALARLQSSQLAAAAGRVAAKMERRECAFPRPACSDCDT